MKKIKHYLKYAWFICTEILWAVIVVFVSLFDEIIKRPFLSHLILFAIQFIMWISASQRADNNRTYEILWRAKYIESRALLGLSLRQTDLIIDQITAHEMAMWDLYCSRKDLFRENIARKAMEDVTKTSK